MKVTFLKAGNGDSILIEHDKHNILIDGGNESSYVCQKADEIFNRDEVLDLIIITHHDDDHIRGIIDLLKRISDNSYDKKGSELIKKVIFNSPRRDNIQTEGRELSYRQAYEVEELLVKNKINWEGCSDASGSLKFGSLELFFLSPTESDKLEYVKKQGDYLSSDFRCDWKSAMKDLEGYLDDDSQDNSLYNRSGIVVMCTADERKILLPGDVTPKRLEAIVSQLKQQQNVQVVEFEFMPLPHHGSYRNINQNILENIKCAHFIISTNSRKHFLPNKRALLKVLKNHKRAIGPPIRFSFNYQEALSSLNISEEEKKRYNFSTYSNNKEYGLVV